MFKIFLNLGAAHADELPFLFNSVAAAELTKNILKEGTLDNRIMNQMVESWTNFAITG